MGKEGAAWVMFKRGTKLTFCVAGLFSPIFLFRLYSVDQMNLEHDDGLSAQVFPEFVFSLQSAFLMNYRHVYREVLKYQR